MQEASDQLYLTEDKQAGETEEQDTFPYKNVNIKKENFIQIDKKAWSR